jgi:hypothetical protein
MPTSHAKVLHPINNTALNKILNTIKTKKMEKQNYAASILANKGGLEVFNKINQVSGWWTENNEGGSESQQEYENAFALILKHDGLQLRLGEAYSNYPLDGSNLCYPKQIFIPVY